MDLISWTYFSNINKIKTAIMKITLVAKYSHKNEVAMTLKSNFVIKANWLKFYLPINIHML